MYKQTTFGKKKTPQLPPVSYTTDTYEAG